MRDSIPFGPVEADSLIWYKVALHKFQRDSLIAVQKTDSFFCPVDVKLIQPFHKLETATPPQLVPSLFSDHKLTPKEYGNLKIASQSEGWVSFMLLGILLLIGILNWR